MENRISIVLEYKKGLKRVNGLEIDNSKQLQKKKTL